MKRHLWLLCAAFATVLFPVAPARGRMTPAAAPDCCRAARACGQHESAPRAPPTPRDCPACPPCHANCCVAILPLPDAAAVPLAAIGQLHPRMEKGEQR